MSDWGQNVNMRLAFHTALTGLCLLVGCTTGPDRWAQQRTFDLQVIRKGILVNDDCQIRVRGVNLETGEFNVPLDLQYAVLWEWQDNLDMAKFQDFASYRMASPVYIKLGEEYFYGRLCFHKMPPAYSQGGKYQYRLEISESSLAIGRRSELALVRGRHEGGKGLPSLTAWWLFFSKAKLPPPSGAHTDWFLDVVWPTRASVNPPR